MKQRIAITNPPIFQNALPNHFSGPILLKIHMIYLVDTQILTLTLGAPFKILPSFSSN